jgi:TolA-binding protein
MRSRWPLVFIGIIAIVQAASSRARAEDAPRDTPSREQDVRGLQVFFDELQTAVERSRGYTAVVSALERREHEGRNGEQQRRLVADLAALAEARRLAITALEAFVTQHPDDPDLTPDALLRLAELRYQDTTDRYTEELERWTALAERQQEGEAVELPAEPTRDDSRCIDLTRRIVRQFPGFPHIDGALVLLGLCLSEAGELEEALSAFLHLACADHFQYSGPPAPGAAPAAPSAAPPGPFVDPYASCSPVVEGSRFVTEAWFRIGELHFDYDLESYGLDRAIAAYRNAARDRGSRLHEIALYKLAWSFYRADRYPDAIEQFVAVATLAAQTSTVRPEAITYLGICFAEDDWDLDLQSDAARGIDRLQDPALLPQDLDLTREVSVATANTYFDLARYDDAIAVYELILRRWPLALEAPRMLERVVTSHERERRLDEAAAARHRLSSFGPGSEWQRLHASTDPETVAEAGEMARNALYDAAVRHHQVAQQLRQAAIAAGTAEQQQRAVEEYGRAVEGYRAYLERYPQDPDTYELTYNMAEALFFSERYREAAEVYASVRDSTLDDRFREEAARGAARALELLREGETHAP